MGSVERASRPGIYATAFAAMLVLVPPAAVSAGEDSALASAADAKQFGREALFVVKNYFEHAGEELPDGTGPVIRQLLENPFGALQSAATVEDLVRRSYGLRRPAWRRLLASSREPRRGGRNCKAGSLDVREIVGWYITALEKILGPSSDRFKASCRNLPGDSDRKREILGLLNAEARKRISLPETDNARLSGPIAVVAGRWFDLHRELGICVREMNLETVLRQRPGEFSSRLGRVVIGGPTDDIHDMHDAFMVIDVGGSDRYRRHRADCGEAKVIVDLSGDDTYLQDDASLFGFQASIDRSGNDRYSSAGAGNGATFGGLSLLLDLAGNDTYRNGKFGQGAAAHGVSALIDANGDDEYVLGEAGQGFGATGGTGILWDVAGDDTYTATGRFSLAQGSAFGWRFLSAGGIGVLADDSGDENYQAERFAQGSGYYFGVGVLRDRAGKDHYKSVRYAQGAGVHAGFGVLEDLSGNDRYEAGVGVAQGMGLDFGFGILRDHAGDDRYKAPALAQGASTANGVGILADAGGIDAFTLDEWGWGQDHLFRRLPGLGFLLGAEPQDAFYRQGKRVLDVRLSEAGPRAHMPPRSIFPELACPAAVEIPPKASGSGSIIDKIRQSAPFDGLTRRAIENYATTVATFPGGLKPILEAIDATDADAIFALRGLLRCFLQRAPGKQQRAVARIVIENLMDPRRTLPAWLHGEVLLRIPDELGNRRKAIEYLFADDSCRSRSLAVELAATTAGPSILPSWAEAIVGQGLSSNCWHLQAASIYAAKKLSVTRKASQASRPMPFMRRIEALYGDEASRQTK